MYTDDLLARIEVIIDDPATTPENKIALKEGCRLIKNAITIDDVVKAIEFVAAVAGIAHFYTRCFTMNLGKTIRDLRKRQGLTQGALADAAGISRTAMSQIENGVRPGEETLKSICAALQVPESLLYIHSMEKEDVPESKRVLYDQLFPVIQEMIQRVAGEETKNTAASEKI
jgi:transcriptional regulator with XRE-family HTH domain